MEDIIEKIRKLRELAKSSNINEAAAAAAAADKLIAKHRLSEEELIVDDISLSSSPEEDTDVLYESGRITAWKSNLACELAHHYGCQIVNKKSYRNSKYHLIGRKSDMDIVKYMFSWLSVEIERLSVLNCKGAGKIAASSYCDGAVSGIRGQLLKSKQEVKAEAESTGKTAALVKVDNRIQESLDYMNSQYSNLKKGTVSKRSFDSSAYAKGKLDGSKIHLGKSLPS